MVVGDRSFALASFAAVIAVIACVGPGPVAEGTEGDETSTATETTTATAETETETETTTDPDTGPPDLIGPDPPDLPEYFELDVLIVVDNSASMGEEQQTLAAAAPQLIDSLVELEDASVNVMVTSTDMGHPLCAPFNPEGYEPKRGAPEELPCLERLADFTSLGADPIMMPEACEGVCPNPVAPVDPYVHVRDRGQVTNVPGNAAGAALACLVPQGINGCGYEAPLESMLQALNPDAPWNDGSDPFLRDDAILAIISLSDEADCSSDPEGYAHFIPPNDTYWEINPDTGTKTNPTSAVCWNAGVDCGMPDMDGTYPDCTAVDNEVLYPTSRYVDYLVDELRGNQGKEIVMLALSGVPTVTAHSPDPPFQPIAGGVLDLVYREWIDAPYPAGDILPGDDDAATKEYLFGIGPGCTGEDGMGGFTGQAIPPVRIKEVCQALDADGELRCCIESVCDGDHGPGIQCLKGMVETIVMPD